MNTPALGTIGWFDLTVRDATAVRDFYQDVVGWSAQPLDMGGYTDYCMIPPGSDAPVAGVCHARGPNAEIPPQWLIYITVKDVAASVAACRPRGGKVILEPREMGGGIVAVIADPAGAACALYQTLSVPPATRKPAAKARKKAGPAKRAAEKRKAGR